MSPCCASQNDYCLLIVTTYCSVFVKARTKRQDVQHTLWFVQHVSERGRQTHRWRQTRTQCDSRDQDWKSVWPKKSLILGREFTLGLTNTMEWYFVYIPHILDLTNVPTVAMDNPTHASYVTNTAPTQSRWHVTYNNYVNPPLEAQGKNHRPLLLSKLRFHRDLNLDRRIESPEFRVPEPCQGLVGCGLILWVKA